MDPFDHFVVNVTSYANFESFADRFHVQDAREARLTASQAAAEPLGRGSRSSVSEGLVVRAVLLFHRTTLKLRDNDGRGQQAAQDSLVRNQKYKIKSPDEHK